jgi:hypothetical protein
MGWWGHVKRWVGGGGVRFWLEGQRVVGDCYGCGGFGAVERQWDGVVISGFGAEGYLHRKGIGGNVHGVARIGSVELLC